MAPHQDAARELATLLEKDRIVDTIVELFVRTDQRDWPAVLECFAEEVWFDMSSLTGVPASASRARDIVAGWEQGLAALRAVHHQAGNFRVKVLADEANASCYAIATHYLPNASGRNTRTFVGGYDLRLRKDAARWRITSFRFDVKYVDGNLELERSG
jgi:hypothetical protein